MFFFLIPRCGRYSAAEIVDHDDDLIWAGLQISAKRIAVVLEIFMECVSLGGGV